MAPIGQEEPTDNEALVVDGAGLGIGAPQGAQVDQLAAGLAQEGMGVAGGGPEATPDDLLEVVEAEGLSVGASRRSEGLYLAAFAVEEALALGVAGEITGDVTRGIDRIGLAGRFCMSFVRQTAPFAVKSLEQVRGVSVAAKPLHPPEFPGRCSPFPS